MSPVAPDQPVASIVADVVSGEPEPDPYGGKNPAAVELGRLGGLQGGGRPKRKLTAA